MRGPDDLGPPDFERIQREVHMALAATLPRECYARVVEEQCKREVENAYLAAVDLRWLMGDTDAWSAAWAAEVAGAATAYHTAMNAVAARARTLDRAERVPKNVARLPSRPRIAQAREALNRLDRER